MAEPAPGVGVRVVFLTGQSDPGSCALSPVQAAFLAALPLTDAERGPLNFPYRAGLAPHRPTPLLRASWHNTRLTLAAQRPGFARAHAAPVDAELSLATRTLVLAGSCGLELLRALDLPAATLARLHVLAYGPVSRGRPACAVETVVGRGDRISLVRPAAADHVVPCGHLDYLTSPDVLGIAAAALARLRVAP